MHSSKEVIAFYRRGTMSTIRIVSYIWVIGVFCNGEQFIVGGSEASKGDWPWMLDLEVEDTWKPDREFRHQCGASLLTSRWALTAAHCLWDEPKFRVQVGSSKSSPSQDAEETVDVDYYIPHPEYDNMGKGIPNDIALLHLSRDVDLTNQYVSTIHLPEKGEDFVGNGNCWITGWGRYDEGLPDHSPILKQLRTKVLKNNDCQERIDGMGDPFYHIFDFHICSDDTGNVGPCNMDSGGPFHCDRSGKGDWVLAGVLSWGGSPCSHYPGVYTRVSEYLEWIRKHVPGV